MYIPRQPCSDTDHHCPYDRTLARTSSSGSLARIQPRLPQTMFKNVDSTHCVQEATSTNVLLLSTRHSAVRKNDNEKRTRRNVQFYQTRWVSTTSGYPYWPATCSSSLDLTHTNACPPYNEAASRATMKGCAAHVASRNGRQPGAGYGRQRKR
jgi:hypothetical protein